MPSFLKDIRSWVRISDSFTDFPADSCASYNSYDDQHYLMNNHSAEERQHSLSAALEDFMRQGSSNNNDIVADKLDYRSQIERWNKYQNILDKIEEKCKHTKGDVILRRNIKHNVKILDDVSIAFLSVIGLTALMIIVGGLIEENGSISLINNSNNYYAIIGGLLAFAFVGWQIVLRLFPPSIIRFTCRPALHIEEYAYMNKHVRGIPKVTRDPVIRLPPMEMQIPRSWLAQQGLLEFMESLQDIKFDINDKEET